MKRLCSKWFKGKEIDWVDLASYVYMYSSVLLFLLTWIKSYLAIPLIILLIIMIISLTLRKKEERQYCINKKQIFFMIGTFLFILLWCFGSGLGGYVDQSGDWVKHNIIFRDLVEYGWPVRFCFDGRDGILTYYIGQYLIPAAVGKFFGIDVGHTFMLIWSATGIFLACLNLSNMYGRGKNCSILLISIFVSLFGPFTAFMARLLEFICPGLGTYGGEWIGNGVLLQYSANGILLRYVFPQFIVPLIAVTLFLKHKNDYKVWGGICVPLMLYATFPFVGMVLIMGMAIVWDFIGALKQKKEAVLKFLKNVFSWENIVAVVSCIPIFLYILTNILNDKPEEAIMNFMFYPPWEHWEVFIFFQLSWLLWIILLIKKENKNKYLYFAAVVLAVLPCFIMGKFNDFCMRTSIPALLIINIIVIKNILQALDEEVGYALLLIMCLFVTGYMPVKAMEDSVARTQFSREFKIDRKYDRVYQEIYLNETNESYYFSGPSIQYQYINWEPDSTLAKLILKD